MRRPWCELQVVGQWTFRICGANLIGFVAELVVGRIGFAVEVVVVVGGEVGYVAEVVEGGWRWVDAIVGRAEALAFALADEGY
jgi:hypothetical protein